MVCEQWKESMVARLYDELGADEGRALERHLESCEPCRRALEDLRGARELLRDAEPATPVAPRVVMLTPPRSRPAWIAFAAGFAAAAVLAAGGLVAGMTLATPGPQTNGVAASAPGRDAGVEPAWVPTLASIQRRLDEQDGRIQALAAAREQGTMTRADFEGGLDRLQTDINRQRAEDLQLLLREIAGVELRTDERIGQTRDALRYVMLASSPGVTSQ